MKNVLIIAFLTIVVLAVILGIKAFVWVFSSVFYYGCIALLIALLIFAWWKLTRKTKEKNDGKQNG